MHIIFESVLMSLTQNYQNQSTLVETTACRSFLVFLRHSVVRKNGSHDHLNDCGTQYTKVPS